MRLIDADLLVIDLMDRGVEGLQTDDWYEIQQVIMDAPTIEVEPVTHGRWIPIKTRPMTDAERKYYEELLGWRLSDDAAVMFENKMPDDRQEVWVCSEHGYVYNDVCRSDDLFGLEVNGDWAGITAWMPCDIPKPYREVKE